MKSNITLEVFESIVIEQLKERGYNTKIVETPGKLGSEHRLIKEPCKNGLTAAIRIEEIYDDYMKRLTSGHPVLMEKVVDGIIESFNMKPPVNYASVLTMLESWDEAKGRLFIAVYNKNRHASYLKDKVYTCIEDLAIVPRLLVGRRSDGVMSLIVSQKLLKTWGKTEKEVMTEAFKSAPVVMPIEVRNLSNLVKEMLFNMKEAGEEVQEVPEDLETHDSDMMVVTTRDNFTGASLFYDGVLEMIAKQFDDFFYIFPSSTCEFIVVSGKSCPYPEELSRMVSDVNSSSVPPDCVLSDHAYVYRNGKLDSL